MILGTFDPGLNNEYDFYPMLGFASMLINYLDNIFITISTIEIKNINKRIPQIKLIDKISLKSNLKIISIKSDMN